MDVACGIYLCYWWLWYTCSNHARKTDIKTVFTLEDKLIAWKNKFPQTDKTSKLTNLLRLTIPLDRRIFSRRTKCLNRRIFSGEQNVQTINSSQMGKPLAEKAPVFKYVEITSWKAHAYGIFNRIEPNQLNKKWKISLAKMSPIATINKYLIKLTKARICHCAGGLSSLSDESKTRFMCLYLQVDKNELSGWIAATCLEFRNVLLGKLLH